MSDREPLKPWETKTIEHLTQDEMLDWVEWTITRVVTGRHPRQLATDIFHNVLLWERTKPEASQ